MKVYVVMVYDTRFDFWNVDQRCYTSCEAAEKQGRMIKDDTGNYTQVVELDLVDDLQAYAEQRNGDTVNHPEHYTNGEIECIDAIRAALTAEQYAGYLRGNILKYLWRFDRKGGAEDLRKARKYLEWLIEIEEVSE